MSGITVGAHAVALLLVMLQCTLVVVMVYRLCLLSRVCKGVAPHRTNSYVVSKALRVCIFIMTALQCVRCIDPFAAQGIWPYPFTRSVTLLVTITLYFQYSAITYIVMDTLFACALKRTPTSLAIIVSILPAGALVIGLAGLIGEFRADRQWVSAVSNFYVVVSLFVNVATYNASGLWLIAIIRKHQLTGSAPAGEDISGSKTATPFELVVAKTFRSMALLTAPSVIAMILYTIIGIGNSNTRPIPAYNPQAIGWNSFVTIFVQLILGLVFTRVAWINKTTLDAELMAKMISTQSTTSASKDEKPRASRTASKAELKEKAARLSQMPRPRSEGSESVAVTGVEAPVLPAVEITALPAVEITVLPAVEITVLPAVEITVLPAVEMV